MKLTCNREKLLVALQTVGMVVPARSPKPILQKIKLEADKEQTTLLATDLETGIRFDVAGVECETPGSVILPASRIAAILRESSDETLELEGNDEGTQIRGQRSEFQLSGEDPREFPAVASFSESNYFEIPARLLRELIRRTVFATDVESTRYALGGILLELEPERITAIGTDGRRLAKMEGPLQSVGEPQTPDSMIIVPAKAMTLIERSLSNQDAEVKAVVNPNGILVKGERITIYSRLVEGRFPKWRDVFPQREQSVQIELAVGVMHSAVRQAAVVTSNESRGVDFTFSEGKATLASRTPQLGQSHIEIPVPYDGAELSITLDPRYLTDFLKVLDQEKSFTLELKDAESAAVCSTDDGYGYVIMPLARDAK